MTHKAVGIYSQEIFIAELDKDGNFVRFSDVLRPVSTDKLEELRDADSYKEYCRDLWECAVRAGTTELGLLAFAQELIDEADIDNDDEAFPCKDDSGLEYLTVEEREAADKFMSEHEDTEVGTWECGGAYSPNSFSDDFKKFDYVFDKKLAKQYYDKIKNNPTSVPLFA